MTYQEWHESMEREGWKPILIGENHGDDMAWYSTRQTDSKGNPVHIDAATAANYWRRGTTPPQF
jgi:hypothetical protein